MTNDAYIPEDTENDHSDEIQEEELVSKSQRKRDANAA